MSDKRQLIDAILADPLADEPRLIYADWLDEHDNPRGEFIRVQIQLFNNKTLAGEPLKPSARAKLMKAQRSLFSEQFEAWGSDDLAILRAKFVRGLPGHVTLSVDALLRTGADVFAKFPIESLTLTGGKRRQKELIGCSLLQNIRSLHVRGVSWDAGMLSSLFQCEHLRVLEALHLDRNNIANEQGAFGILPAFQLKQLRLTQADVDDDGMRLLADNKGHRDLEDLRITQTSELRGEFLSDAVFLNRLRSFWIDCPYLGSYSPMLATITSIQHQLPQLRRLLLHEQGISNQQFMEFVLENPFPNLSTLGMNGNRISDEGAFLFADSELIERLTDVRLSKNNMSAEGIRALYRSIRRRRSTKFYLPQQRFAPDIQAMKQEFGSFGAL